MKWIIILLVALLIGGIAGPWIKDLPGIVIIAYEKTSYEMRLWVAVAFLLITVFLLFLAIWTIYYFFSRANKIKGWHGGRKGRRSRKLTIEGMLAFTEGRWKAAEKSMIEAAKTSDTQLINYLIAAQAAQHQNAEVRRDSYLRQAHIAEPAAKVAIGLTQAQLQLQQNQFEHALASLTELEKKSPNHPYVQKLLCQLFEQLQDWQKLLDLLPSLKKHHVYSDSELMEIEHRAIAGLLKQQAEKQEIEKLVDTWQKLPSNFRKEKTNILNYAELLLQFEQFDQAFSLIKSLVKKHADNRVLTLLGNIKTEDPAKQLSFLENWYESNQSAPKAIHLTLGKLAFHAELWGKARFFLERALQTQPSAEAYWYMAETLKHLDEPQHAYDCYQQGLEFILSPNQNSEILALPKGSEDMVSAELLPKFQKLEN